MTKYFIENGNGEWLVVPGEYQGSCWTRNPYKAWSFDEVLSEGPGRCCITIYREPNGRSVHGPDEAVRVWQLLGREGILDPGIKITKQEFMGESFIVNSEYNGTTVKWVWCPMFDE